MEMETENFSKFQKHNTEHEDKHAVWLYSVKKPRE